MKILGYVLILLGIILGFGGLSVASQPSVMPIATVMGAFAVPALLIWWGIILIKKNNGHV
jgi:hypothetical protein